MIQRSKAPRRAVTGVTVLQRAVGLEDAARDLGAGAAASASVRMPRSTSRSTSFSWSR
jgi:hypothetical protein